MGEINTSLYKIFKGFSNSLLVEKPCQVVKVNSQYSVDIEYYDNNEADMLYNVPVKHMQTGNAYVFLGLRAGDRGTVRFFDNDVVGYIRGQVSLSKETRVHNINDNLFSAGFYPAKERYAFPDGDLVIGTSAGAMINLSGNGITICGGSVTISGNTTIDGVNFLEHTHVSGKEGSSTSGVN